MERIGFARILFACVLGTVAWLAPGKASAINCTPDDSQLRLSVPSQVYVNRLTAAGPITTPNTQGTQLVCTGGPVGTPIEVALRVHPTLQARANEWGAGLLLESSVPGLGVIVQTTSPVMMTQEFQVIQTINRNGSLAQSLLPVEVRAMLAKHGDVDLMQDHSLHGIPLIEMAWRAPGVQDAWQYVTTWSLHAFVAGTQNVLTETCYLGPDATTPLVRTETLGPVGAGDFGGVGEEAAGRQVSGTLLLTCRNYAGGLMTVSSDQAHPTLPGVLRNGLTGDGAASGIGVRVRNTVGGPEWNFLAPWPIPGFRESLRHHHFSYYMRYLQIDPAITPGAFKATITFTVHYD